jgi:glycosyltransferase involved in cell wall biosynthesis
MRQAQVVVYLCNAVDESIRVERSITTDSPAATNKVFALAAAMRGVGIRCTVLSLGRGRENGTGVRHAAAVRRLTHGATLYAAFWQSPWLTHLVSVVSMAWLLVKLLRRHPAPCVLVYNRSYHYLPALLLTRLLGVRAYLDLEDGYIVEGRGGMRHLKNGLTRRLFSWLCPHGSMVANTGLAAQLDRPPAMVCHGVASATQEPCQNWNSERLQVLFSGMLLEEVGCKLLLGALEILRCQHPEVVKGMHVVVTGKGPFAEAFRRWAEQAPEWLSFGESMRRLDYIKVLNSCHVGLSLRLSAYEMGATTFPSKVVEYAQYGLLVLTTRASDVPMLFGKEALYLEEESPQALAALLASLPRLRESLTKTAIRGRKRVLNACAPEVVGQGIRRLLIRNSDGK